MLKPEVWTLKAADSVKEWRKIELTEKSLRKTINAHSFNNLVSNNFI